MRAFAQSGEPHDPRAPSVRALAPPHLRSGVQGHGEGARRRVQPHRSRRRPLHEGNPVTHDRGARLRLGQPALGLARDRARWAATPLVTGEPAAGARRRRPGDPRRRTRRCVHARDLPPRARRHDPRRSSRRGKPVFGVCVGMQVLFDGSEEDPEPGLGVLPGTSRLLPDDVKVPHMGWNTVDMVGLDHPYVADIDERHALLLRALVRTRCRRGHHGGCHDRTVVRSRPRSRRTTCSRRSSTRRSRATRGSRSTSAS